MMDDPVTRVDVQDIFVSFVIDDIAVVLQDTSHDGDWSVDSEVEDRDD